MLLFVLLASLSAETFSPLYSRGYTVMPQPQAVQLSDDDFNLSSDWKVELEGVAGTDSAVRTLEEELDRRFHLKLGRTGRSSLVLKIAPGAARVGTAQDRDRAALATQAYKITLAKDRVVIAANAPHGLYYGVITLVQMLKPGSLQLPQGQIEDWPDLQLRQIYWDNAHHLDRLEALKHAIRRAAFFKVNGFALKLEGHFQFKSAPAVVEPNALSPADYQDLTNYALQHHVQLIPFLDGPAHIAFILKHPEYAKLRAFPGSNYELCTTNPDSYKLLHGMYQDLLDANKGGKYFYLSTDEAYYIGMANSPQCQEAARTKELGSVGKMLAEFVTKAGTYLADRGRTVIFWGEYPLKPEDIPSLPKFLVNGEVYGPQHDPVYKKHGIREMIYTATQGDERLFPQYFPVAASARLHSNERAAGRRVYETFNKLAFDTARRDADLMGMINAGWGDAGLHAETFWLGYVSATASGWHPNSPNPAETMATFYPLFYGPRVSRMDRVYQLMSTQAQFWTDSWETGTSNARKPIWGNSDRIYDTPRPARDQNIPLPPAPSSDLRYSSEWSKQNARRLELAAQFLSENDEVSGLLHSNVALVDSNRYTLEVFASIANLTRHNLDMLQRIGRMDSLLKSASDAASNNRGRQALQAMDRAIQEAREIRYSRNKAFADLTATWNKSQFPRVAEANGRRFLHQHDDVKDHLADRTADLTYVIQRELLLPFGEWVEQIRSARNEYAKAHNMPARSDRFDWKDLRPIYGAMESEITLE